MTTLTNMHNLSSRPFAAFLIASVAIALCSGPARALDGGAVVPPSSAGASAGSSAGSSAPGVLAAPPVVGERAPDDLLRGPTVNDSAPPKTLVRQDFEGRLEPLDTRAEEAGLALLTLDDGERAATEKVLSAHKVAVRALLYDNMDLFLEMQSKRQSGDRDAFRASFTSFRELAAPLTDPTLLDRLTEPLSMTNAAELRRLVGEYREALAKEAAPEEGERPRRSRGSGANAPSEPMGGDGSGNPRARDGARPEGRFTGPAGPAGAGRPGAQAVAQRVEAMALLREMAQTLAATVTERRARMAELITAIDATPEQAEQITSILRDAAESATESKYKASPESRGAMMQKLLAVLTPEQRPLALKHFRER